MLLNFSQYFANTNYKEVNVLAKKNKVAPEARRAIERLKIETAEEIGINTTTKPDMGELTSKQIGSMAKSGRLGGRMVNKMVRNAEQTLANKKNNKS